MYDGSYYLSFFFLLRRFFLEFLEKKQCKNLSSLEKRVVNVWIIFKSPS